MTDLHKELAIRLKAVIETAIDGIIIIDDKGIVEDMNRAAADLFEYDAKEVVGKNIKILMPQPYRAEHDSYIERFNKTKQPRIIGVGREVSGRRKDGSIFPFRLAVSEVILNDRVIFTGIIHDLSEVKRAKDEIISLNQQLAKTVTQRTSELEDTVNKLLATNQYLNKEVSERKIAEQRLKESQEELKSLLEREKELGELKSRFVSMASHEFRTPLTSILSSAAIIGKYTEGGDQQPKREKHINRIKSAVSNLTGILNDFLSLSKLEEGIIDLHVSELNLEELCHEIIEDTKGLLKSDQKINHTIEGEKPIVYVDERILRNILFNLISNAIKYSNDDIQCHILFNEDHFEIQIKDSGIGIPEEDQKYLFSRFFRAGNVTNIQGTGLGLNIVRRYVQLLKGEIRFESEQEVGTTFFVKLPYLEPN